MPVIPDPTTRHPVPGQQRVVFLRSVVTDPRVEVGELPTTTTPTARRPSANATCSTPTGRRSCGSEGTAPSPREAVSSWPAGTTPASESRRSRSRSSAARSSAMTCGSDMAPSSCPARPHRRWRHRRSRIRGRLRRPAVHRRRREPGARRSPALRRRRRGAPAPHGVVGLARGRRDQARPHDHDRHARRDREDRHDTVSPVGRRIVAPARPASFSSVPRLRCSPASARPPERNSRCPWPSPAARSQP